MLTYNNQIFKNCIVIIYCQLRKVSAQINVSIICEPNKLSITLSTLWSNYYHMETYLKNNFKTQLKILGNERN